MKREDLRVVERKRICNCSDPEFCKLTVEKERPVSDADLAALGYVRLDVDVEELREALRRFTSFRPGVRMDNEQVMVDAVSQVLTALDGGEA